MFRAATLARTRTELNFAEEIADFPGRGIRRVRAMDDVLVDARRKIGANRSPGRLLRIGGAHHLAIACDRALALEDLHHDRTRRHEAHQILEERALAMHRIKPLRFRLRELHHARRHHSQARLLKTAIDLADDITADAVRLDDGESALDWHDDLGYEWEIRARSDRLLGADKDREVYWSGRAQAIRMTTEVPVLLGKTWICADLQTAQRQTLKLSPQPHSPLAFGF